MISMSGDKVLSDKDKKRWKMKWWYSQRRYKMPQIKHIRCYKCGVTKTPYWYRDYDSKGDWTGKRVCYECKL